MQVQQPAYKLKVDLFAPNNLWRSPRYSIYWSILKCCMFPSYNNGNTSIRILICIHCWWHPFANSSYSICLKPNPEAYLHSPLINNISDIFLVFWRSIDNVPIHAVTEYHWSIYVFRATKMELALKTLVMASKSRWISVNLNSRSKRYYTTDDENVKQQVKQLSNINKNNIWYVHNALHNM